jgi:hypothetical protein
MASACATCICTAARSCSRIGEIEVAVREAIPTSVSIASRAIPSALAANSV